ncbi:YadA-like family protein [Dialister succinatiphilus]|uniref:YadA-like family protein n=3 Tax=Dialister succinatiphilus TaxID=487173 RepID=UPI003AAC121A
MIKSKKLSSLVAASLILAGGSFLGVQTVSADDATRLAAVEALASQNHSSISELTEKVNKISTTPEQLQQIDTNKDNITKNQTAIQTNADAIKKNSEDIATNKADIATNKADIATNKADIAQEVKNRTKAVADEAAARESGDNALQSQIKKESAARQADISRLDNKIHDVSKEVDTVGALSMAMSGLHPLSYDEGDARFQLSAAVGTYDGTEALALGGFYHFNRDSMLSVGVATDLGADEHRMGANVGYTRRIGQGGHVSRPSEGTVSDIMKDIKNLEQKQAKLEQENEQLKQQLAALKK